MPGGYGRGRRHRHWYRMTGIPGWMRFGDSSTYGSPLQEFPPVDTSQRIPLPYQDLRPEEELRMLEEEEQTLVERIEELRERMKELRYHMKGELGYSPGTSNSKPDEIMPKPYTPYAPLRYPGGSSGDELRILREREKIVEFELKNLRNRLTEIPEVEADSTLGEVYNLLPKQNCGACGYQTCLDCARAMVTGYAPPDSCVMVENDIIDKIEDALFKEEKKNRR